MTTQNLFTNGCGTFYIMMKTILQIRKYNCNSLFCTVMMLKICSFLVFSKNNNIMYIAILKMEITYLELYTSSFK